LGRGKGEKSGTRGGTQERKSQTCYLIVSETSAVRERGGGTLEGTGRGEVEQGNDRQGGGRGKNYAL